MLIGAHVSTGGGLHTAIERGEDLGCEAIQIFNQSPRMWRPTRYEEEDFATFREVMAESSLSSVVIHAIYLINLAGSDKELRKKSLTSLMHALWVGDGIAADGVVVHPGALLGGRRDVAQKRAARALREALAETDRCPLLIEQMAGQQGLLGRNFEEVAELIDMAGGGKRLGACLDSCHLFAAGYDGRTPEGMRKVVDDYEKVIGLGRLRCLHLNDSRDPFGSNRDRHENLGDGELGRSGLQAFLSEPRFDGLPALLEVPGPRKRGPDKPQIQLAKRLRREALKPRK